MRAGIEQGPHALLPFPEDDIASHDQGADRYFTGFERLAPKLQATPHVDFVDRSHDRRRVACRFPAPERETQPYNGPMETKPVDRYLLTLRQHLPELAEKYHVRSLEVFGSFVRNEQTPKSDLDLLVTFDRAPGLFRFIELGDCLSDVLGVKVDLVMKTALKPRLEKRILHEAIPV